MGADVARRTDRMAVQHDDDPAADVEALIIVEAARGQVEPVAGEDEGRLGRELLGIGGGAQDEIAAVPEGPPADGDPRRPRYIVLDQPDRLEPAVLHGVSQPQRLILVGDVTGGGLMAARTRLAPLEPVVGEIGDMGAERVG
jgi:hypothetical protein